jgi:predicted nuclease of predicted toxin-antitoxin system
VNNFLLDANLSPRTGTFLQEAFGFNVVHAGDLVPPGAPDEDVVAAAQRQQRVIITLDPDFGELYHTREKGRLGVIVLRLRNQTRPSVNRVLEAFFRTEAETIELATSLVVIDEARVRVSRPAEG